MNFTQLMDGVALSAASASINAPGDWAQGRTLYGGLQAALALKAMEGLVDDNRPLRSFQANFIGPVSPGFVVADATLLRQGKSSTQVRATIAGSGQIRFFAVAIFGVGRSSRIDYTPIAAPVQYAKERCELNRMDEDHCPFNPHIESYWPPGIHPYSESKENRVTVYVRHKDDSVTSNAHLLALADGIPPLVVMQLSAFVPLSTMSWQLEVYRDAATLAGQSWFRFDVNIDACRDGYCTQTTHMWTMQNELVAIGQQCIAVFG